MESITPSQAYRAMIHFLENHYRLTRSDDLGSLLGSMSLLTDGKPADSALWSDWLQAIRQSKGDEGGTHLTLKT